MAGQIMARVAFASSVSSHQMDSKPIQHYSTLFNIKLNHRHQMPTAKPIEGSWNILTASSSRRFQVLFLPPVLGIHQKTPGSSLLQRQNLEMFRTGL